MNRTPLPPNELESASVLQRFIAQAIDCAVIAGLLIAPSFVDELLIYFSGTVTFPPGVVRVLHSIPLFLAIPLAVAYRLVGDGFAEGAGLGKRVMKIHVVDAVSRRPCSIGQAAIRVGVYIIPFTYLIEPILLICDGQLRWGDHVAGTCVLRRVPKTPPSPTTPLRPLNLAGLSETMQKIRSQVEG